MSATPRESDDDMYLPAGLVRRAIPPLHQASPATRITTPLASGAAIHRLHTVA